MQSYPRPSAACAQSRIFAGSLPMSRVGKRALSSIDDSCVGGRSDQPLFAKWLESCKYRAGQVEGSMMINLRKQVALLVSAASVVGLLGSASAGAETIKAVMNSDLKILDPIWTP